MNGELQEHPLVELLEEIHAEGLTGALRLEQERVKAVIYLEDGEIIYAASNVRLHRLLACLQRWGVVSDADLAALPDRDSDSTLSAALTGKGLFMQQQVEEMVTRQVTEILQSVLLWTAGNWTFDARVRLVEGVRIKVSRQTLSLEAGRRLPGEFISTRLTNGDEKLFPVALSTVYDDLLPREAFVLSRIDSPMRMSELIWGSGLPEVETLKMIYCLALSGHLRREAWPKAFTSEAIAKAKSAKAQIPVAPPPPSEAEPVTTEQAAVVNAATPVPKVEVEEDELESFFARMSHAEDYYETLGVRRRATIAEIKGAYHTLAKRFHPDRYHRETENDLHARVEVAFAEIARAYETLKEKQSRASYDLKLHTKSRQQKSANPAEVRPSHSKAEQAPQQQKPIRENQGASPDSLAKAKYEQGVKLLNNGNFTLALTLLSEAARLIPTEARYRAFYGQALARQERTRRSAEAEIQAAIALDAYNASYRVMLAELYRDLGFSKRAAGELERALSLEPLNSVARRLLNEISGSSS